MTESEKLKHCDGCRNDYYNRDNNSTTRRCWLLPGMKLVWKKEVHINQLPPWTQKPIHIPECYRKPQHVYVDPKQTY